MKIEIWSDIMCPFCYIGKRRFEEALATFEGKNDVEIEWKSFLLSPELKTDPTKNIHQYLAEHKNISLEEAKGMNDYVTNMAAQVGLTYNFDKAIPANSFNAHRFLHFAKKHGKQNEAEERLFKAYFTEGKNIDDAQTLLLLAIELELDANKLADAMNNGEFTNDVIADINEAQQLGVRGVPFFVFNRKYAVSGAQESEAFTQTLEKAFEEWQASQPKTSFETIKGESCDIDGNCD
ncbi:thioredoxin domain-containing protein [Flavobacterium rakeshii]|uniref:Thioredoxin domain-containing protein n=1 Tax=Flavobacterium rakeshii TaxID=1038845 RepID=A0A6N8HIF2_9FLAO|nr:DsbA family oxidoreductase [Flavobacterium rakeshii]MUV05522.1 thioredoxin domain-containing protein [Flavobacterium rakeshii]